MPDCAFVQKKKAASSPDAACLVNQLSDVSYAVLTVYARPIVLIFSQRGFSCVGLAQYSLLGYFGKAFF